MYHKMITSPKTGRQNRVRVWAIHPSRLYQTLGKAAFQDARELSWHLLEESIDDMAAEQHGDCSQRNFALSVFENALDWRIGHTVQGVLSNYQKHRPGFVPRRLFLAINRSGDVFYRVGTNNPWRNGLGNGS